MFTVFLNSSLTNLIVFHQFSACMPESFKVQQVQLSSFPLSFLPYTQIRPQVCHMDTCLAACDYS